MTNSLKLFESYFPCLSDEKVRIAYETFSQIAGKCSIKISKRISLKSILHVPKLRCNLLYVSKLFKDSNYCVIFFESHCVFQDHSLGKTIGNARMKDGPYYFEDNLPGNKIVQGFSSVSSIPVYEQIMVWHYQLGHPNFTYLKHLFQSLFKNINLKSLQYESCVLAKSH